MAVVAAVVVIAALATGHVMLLRLGYALTATVVVAGALAWSSVRWLSVERHTRTRRSEVGGIVEESFTLRNGGWVPKLWLEVRDESDLPGHFASRVVTTLGPSRTRCWAARSRCRRRGIYTLGPITIAGGDPLGMFRSERHLPASTPLVVFPRTVALRALALPRGQLSGGRPIRRRADYATTNVRGVRDYQPGDAFSRIHWRTTARRGRLFTKEFEFDPIADFWVVLDLEHAAHRGEVESPPDDAAVSLVLGAADVVAPPIEPTTEEHAVTIAASIARHLLDSGRSVGLIAHGQRRIALPPDRGERQATKILTHLAVLRAVGGTPLRAALSAESVAFARHATLIVITPSTSPTWVPGLRELRYRGVASIVILLDARTFGAGDDCTDVLAALQTHRLPVRRVCCGDDIAAALA